jgi:ribonuclease-3
MGRPQPTYVLVKERGPEHSKTFTVQARLLKADEPETELVGQAEGSTKKNAEQGVARQLLEYLESPPAGKRSRAPGEGPVAKP